jgi:Tol biopolymer transport system component
LHSSGPQLNPNIKSKLLQIPYKNVFYATVSADGDWIAFPAADEHSKWDVYLMNTSAGESRRITYDSCYSINSVEISPNGSAILNTGMQSAAVIQLAKVSSLGGSPKIIY